MSRRARKIRVGMTTGNFGSGIITAAGEPGGRLEGGNAPVSGFQDYLGDEAIGQVPGIDIVGP